tara:strand:- start:159 stop:323 length:165 start_codon:yes stop_codon:yes gene_type:complete
MSKVTPKEIKRRIARFKQAYPEIDWEHDPFYKPPPEGEELTEYEKWKRKRGKDA